MTILDEHTSRHSSLLEQRILDTACVGVLGSDNFADMVVLVLAGLGIGTVYHKENSQKGFLSTFAKSERKSRLEKIQELNYSQEHIIVPEDFSFSSLDVVIDCNSTKTSSNHLLGVFAGMLGQNILEVLSKEEITKNTYSSFFQTVDSISKKILLVGAGATGTHVALAAALGGFKEIDIIDKDVIETHNLNRQSLYYQREGEYKSQVLSEHLCKLGCKSSAYIQYLSENTISSLANYDIIFSCVDLFSPRRILNAYCVENKKILIDGGTSANSGRVASYVPGFTKSLGEQVELEIDDPEPNTSCGSSTTPSIIMPNMIIGSLMIDQALASLQTELIKNRNKIIRYDRLSNKIYFTSSRKQEVFCGS